MPLLAGVFLSDLQLDGFVSFFQTAEEGRNGLAHLEIDWAMLNLDDDVIGKLAIERMKNVVGRAGGSFLGLRQSRWWS